MRVFPVLTMFLILGLLISKELSAQGRFAELQWRILTHIQIAPEEGMGVAGWVIFPDVLQSDPSRILILFGVMEAWDKRWIELMGGVLRNGNKTEPVINIRFSKSDLNFLDLFLEVQHNISTRTLYLNPIAAIPLNAGGFAFKAGLDIDWFLFPDTEDLWAGPRVSTAFSGSGVVRNVQMTAAYKFRRMESPILRVYLLLNFHLGH